MSFANHDTLTVRIPLLLRISRMVSIFHMAFMKGALFMLAFLAACSGTLEIKPEPGQQDSESAVLEGYWRYLFLYIEQLGISSVDGKRASGLLGYADSVSLPRGGHWIEIKLDRNYGLVARCAFELNIDSRRHYQIKAIKYKGLLAHPLSSPYKSLILLEAAEHGEPAQALSVAAVCTSAELLCRRDADCSPDHSCRMDPGFDFGTCNPPDH